MQIVHHIALQPDDAERQELGRLGIDLDADRFVAFDVLESDERWPGVKEWIARRRPSHIIWTRFSRRELARASWLAIRPTWHHGYPQPNEDEFGFLAATYDLSNYCEACGIGLVQNAPFQMKREPRWGRRAILQLNWVFDEYFVKPEVWRSVFEPLGVGQRAVTDPAGAVLDSVTTRLGADTCGQCGRPRYSPVVRGPVPALIAEPACPMVKSAEYFGSGASAHHEVLVSSDLFRAIESRKVRGATFVPVAAAGA